MSGLHNAAERIVPGTVRFRQSRGGGLGLCKAPAEYQMANDKLLRLQLMVNILVVLNCVAQQPIALGRELVKLGLWNVEFAPLL